jgi:hypothetical protein
MPEFYTFLQSPVCRGTMMKICGSEQGTMAKNERKLTPAEQKRKEQFALVCEEMERQGYRKIDLTIGVVKANLLALIVMLPFAVLSGAVVLSRVSFLSMAELMSPFDFLLFLLVMLLLTAVHEGIHALTWAMFGKDYWKSIRFGVIWKALTPYCTCLRPAKRGQYILGAAMPTLVLGIGLTAAAALTGVYWVFILALAMIFGGGGDFAIILKMLLHRQQGRDAVYYDHPYECGVVVFEKD